MTNLPAGWTEATIGNVCDINPPRDIDLDLNDLVSFVPMPALDEISGEIVRPVDRPLRQVAKGFTQLRDGDVVFAKITPSMENGKSAVVRRLTNSIGFGSTEFYVLRSTGAIEADYLWRYVRRQEFRDNAKSVMTGAVGQLRVPSNYLRTHPIPLPPLAEQRRIVAKLDHLLARTTRARADLDRIPVLIAKYKEALLASAFRGNLTAAWRLRQGQAPPPVSQVRAAVISERDKRRVAEGVRSKGANRNIPPGIMDLPALPRGWAWLSFEECSWDLTVGHVGPMKDRYVPSGIPFLRSLNIKPNRVDLTDIVYIGSDFDRELRKSRLETGTIVVVRTGAPGVAAVIPPELDGANCSDLVICRPVDSVDPYYAAYFINSIFAQNLVSGFQVGVAQQHFNVGAMSRMALPYAPIEEQREIVSHLDTAFGWLDRLAAEHARAARLLPKLDQAILARAFRGELVPQDPRDEPASELLARIRATKGEQPNRRRGGKSRRDITPRAHREGAAMTKSRDDDDVRNKPYLADLLRETDGSANVEDLFKRADLTVADFYKQLKWEVDNGHIRDDRKRLEAA